MPEWVVCVGYSKFRFRLVQISAEFLGIFPRSTVDLQYFTLVEVKLDARNVEHSMAFSGLISQVRVDKLS